MRREICRLSGRSELGSATALLNGKEVVSWHWVVTPTGSLVSISPRVRSSTSQSTRRMPASTLVDAGWGSSSCSTMAQRWSPCHQTISCA